MGTDTRVRTCNRAAPSDRSATVTAGCGSSNFPKKVRNASVSFRCDSGLMFAGGDVEAGKQSGSRPCWARLDERVIGGHDWALIWSQSVGRIHTMRATKTGRPSTVLYICVEQKTGAKTRTRIGTVDIRKTCTRGCVGNNGELRIEIATEDES